ncbi:MAG: hypothetical protein IT454_21960 [Planctomycetes bacterium]|nr:hypothetical protein [Planctomycetota bacterium]
MSISSLALLLALALQSPTLRSDTWPSGARKSECGEIVVDGRKVLDGDFQAWHENGQLEAQGKYVKGERSGLWKTYWSNGQPRSRGAFARDRRKGQWTVWREDGSEDPLESGVYRFERTEIDDGAAREGYYRDELRHGEWLYTWPDGRIQLTGEFRNGRRDGAWAFFGLDGAPCEHLLSGIYEAGVRRSELTAEQLADLRREVEATGRRREFARERAPAWFFETKSFDAAFARIWSARSPADWNAFTCGLLALDPANSSDRAAALGLIRALRGMAHGHGFGASPMADEAKPDLTALSSELRHWSALLALSREDFLFWTWDSAAPCSPSDPPVHSGACAPLASPTPRGDERTFGGRPLPDQPIFAPRFRVVPVKGQALEAERAVDAALNWLVCHQGPDGSWDGDGFSARCGRIAPHSTCSGGGEPDHDVGLTALALLALMSDGNTIHRGVYARQVSDGVASLVARQDQDNGLLDSGGNYANYNHFIGTLALCEALGDFESPELRRAVEGALRYTYRARNPYGGWRYDPVPSGEQDPSVSYWAAASIWTAKQLGVEVDESALDDVRRMLFELTDPNSGRVGYDVPGSISARVPQKNDQFPADAYEGLTGVGLWLSAVLGANEGLEDALRKGVALLQRKLPQTTSMNSVSDMYSWYHCTNALAVCGDPAANAVWTKALRNVLLETQCKSGDELGSWDARNDVWGYAGGRVYTTAVAALCLNAERRYALTPLFDPKAAKKRK